LAVIPAFLLPRCGGDNTSLRPHRGQFDSDYIGLDDSSSIGKDFVALPSERPVGCKPLTARGFHIVAMMLLVCHLGSVSLSPAIYRYALF
jgi:hypothetical protein